MARDTQFSGFAKLLFDELSERGLVAIVNKIFKGPADLLMQAQEEVNQLTQKIIAQRAYDLVAHVLFDHEALEDISVEEITDLTEWPKEDLTPDRFIAMLGKR